MILGIETSCDETALALIETRDTNGVFELRIVDSLVHSQAELHSAYGGVYPSLAKREHGKNLVPLLHRLLTNSSLLEKPEKVLNDVEFKMQMDEIQNRIKATNPDLFESLLHGDFLKTVPKIDKIAVTEGPGLEPALWVGINFARILGELWEVQVIPVNHMKGHIFGSVLNEEAPYGAWQKLKSVKMPALAFLLSGGHTELVQVNDLYSKDDKKTMSRFQILGQTVDDAVGEAFDKVARILGLPYPGGPHVSMLAKKAREEGIQSKVKLPRPMLQSGDLNFSFAGLKTAVLYAVKKIEALTEDDKKGIAREFEEAVSETLCVKLKAAIGVSGAKALIVGGGVSANHFLRENFEKVAQEYDIPIFLPSRHLSGDNALMIAVAGAFEDLRDEVEMEARGTMRIDQL